MNRFLIILIIFFSSFLVSFFLLGGAQPPKNESFNKPSMLNHHSDDILINGQKVITEKGNSPMKPVAYMKKYEKYIRSLKGVSNIKRDLKNSRLILNYQEDGIPVLVTAFANKDDSTSFTITRSNKKMNFDSLANGVDLPGQDVKGIPRIPESTRQYSLKGPNGKFMNSYFTWNDEESIVNFYELEMKRLGWTSSTFKDGPNQDLPDDVINSSRILLFTKDREILHISISPEPTQGGQIILIIKT